MQAGQTKLIEQSHTQYSSICLQSEKALQMWFHLEHRVGHGLRNSPPDRLRCCLQTWASCCRFPSHRFLWASSVPYVGVCVELFWRRTKDKWVCVITPFPKKNDLILVKDNIKMQRTPENRGWAGLPFSLLGKYYSVCGWVCLQQTTGHRGGCQYGKCGCGLETEGRNISGVVVFAIWRDYTFFFFKKTYSPYFWSLSHPRTIHLSHLLFPWNQYMIKKICVHF